MDRSRYRRISKTAFCLFAWMAMRSMAFIPEFDAKPNDVEYAEWVEQKSREVAEYERLRPVRLEEERQRKEQHLAMAPETRAVNASPVRWKPLKIVEVVEGDSAEVQYPKKRFGMSGLLLLFTVITAFLFFRWMHRNPEQA